MRLLLLEVLGLFKAFRSALLPPSCRFSPSCSAYAEQALLRLSLREALWVAFRRLLRCHPFHPGGWDPVPRA